MFDKGVTVLLEACSILKIQGVDFKCHFVGDWMDISEKEFNSIIQKKGLQKNIFYYGPKYGVEKKHFFEMADIFILPSLRETFLIVNIEAMQYSLPVISTYEGGIPDVVIDKKTGFLCKRNDAVCLADKIGILINNPALRKQMGTAGRKRYEENFTLDHFEKKLADILNKI